jgi:catechol 2,3-dioxygenase-like lactoylglutathione lyase family enzyme
MNELSERREIPSAAAPIRPAKLAHFVLRSSHFDEAVEWYCAVLAADIVFWDDRLCFLTYDGEHHRLALIKVQEEPPAPPPVAGVDHISFAYGHLGELLATYRRLAAAGIMPVRTINHGPTISFYYCDPDGLRIELQVDNFATLAESHAFFTSEEFAQNPIGIPVEPEQLIRDYESGTPLVAIQRRPALLPGVAAWDMRKENPTLPG